MKTLILSLITVWGLTTTVVSQEGTTLSKLKRDLKNLPLTCQTNRTSGTVTYRVECRNEEELKTAWEAVHSVSDRVRISRGTNWVSVVVPLPIDTQTTQTTAIPQSSQSTTAPKTKNQVSSESAPVPKTITVHITRTGHKYHRAGCQYLSRSDYPVTLEEAKARGLTPCLRCHPPE